MFESQYLFGGRLVDSVWIRTEVYSPWMPRQGDNIVVTMQTLEHSAATAALAVQLFHKDSEETGPGTAVSGSTATRTTAGTSEVEYAGVKEFVRYKFLCTSTAQDAEDYVLFRMLDPVWYDSVD